MALREYRAMACTASRRETTMITLGGMTIAFAMGLGSTGTGSRLASVICLAGVLIGTLATAKRHATQRGRRPGRFCSDASMAGSCCLTSSGCAGCRGRRGLGVFRHRLRHGGRCGRLFRRPLLRQAPLWPAVSPKKTVEGATAARSVHAADRAAIVADRAYRAMGPFEVLLVSGCRQHAGAAGGSARIDAQAGL